MAPETTVRLVGQLAARPVEGETTVVRLTAPVKPPDGVIVIVELPVAPVLKSAGELAVIVKSPTPKVNTAGGGGEAESGETVPAEGTGEISACGEGLSR